MSCFLGVFGRRPWQSEIIFLFLGRFAGDGVECHLHCIRIFLPAHSTSLLLKVKPTRSIVLGGNSGTEHVTTASLQIPCWVFFVPFAVWNLTKYCIQSLQEIPLTVKWMFWAGETTVGVMLETLNGSGSNEYWKRLGADKSYIFKRSFSLLWPKSSGYRTLDNRRWWLMLREEQQAKVRMCD